MSDVSIRLARPGEEAALSELTNAAHAHEPAFLFTFPNFEQHREWFVNKDAKRYANRIAKQEIACAVVELDGVEKIVGLAAWAYPDAEGNTVNSLEAAEGLIRAAPQGALDPYRWELKCEGNLRGKHFYLPGRIMRKGVSVHPDYQRQGIATKLINYVHNIARDRAMPVMARASPISALLHEKCGYKTLGRWVMRDQREGMEAEYVCFVQEWTPEGVAEREIESAVAQ